MLQKLWPEKPKTVAIQTFTEKFVNSGFRLFELGFLASKLIKAPKEKKPNEEKLMTRTPGQKAKKHSAGKILIAWEQKADLLSRRGDLNTGPLGPRTMYWKLRGGVYRHCATSDEGTQ